MAGAKTSSAAPAARGTMPFVAMLLAWAIPGAGHVYLGRPIRGIIIFIVVTTLFWSGVAMGGVLTVDYVNSRWWFYAEMGTGVHGIVGWHRQKQVYREIMDQQDIRDEAELDKALVAKGVSLDSPTDNIARAYSGIAGMLNLLCIADALLLSLMGVWGEPPRPTRKDEEPPE